MPMIEPMDSAKLRSVINSNLDKKAVLINVWATWCAPCVKEFPDLVQLQKEYANDLSVIFISSDFPDQIEPTRRFLKKQGVDWTTYLKAENDQSFINGFSPDWTGALPATLILNRHGEQITFLEGGQSLETFRKHINNAINTKSSLKP
jgi:thiol-disulfide isomerase/thioredoxin